MKQRIGMRARLRQGGAAAVELAIVLPILITLMTAPFFMAVYFWHYSAVHTSTYGAARFLATVPVREMNSAALSLDAERLTREIVADGLGDLYLSSPPVVSVQCDALQCGDGAPQEVLVDVKVRLSDTFFHRFYTGDRGLLIQATVRMRYAGL